MGVFRVGTTAYFIAPVTHSNVARLAKCLERANRLVITTPGGDLDAARAAYDAVAAAEVATVARGIVASAGAVVFAAGVERETEPSAKFLIHEPRFTLPPMQTVDELTVHLTNARRDREFYVRVVGEAFPWPLSEYEHGAHESECEHVFAPV